MGLGLPEAALIATIAGSAATGIKALTTKAPKASAAPAQELDATSKKQAATRSALYATQGQATGQELNTGQVSSRGTLFGN